MPELPLTFGNERRLLAPLLLAGHVLADFVFQSRWMAENKPHSKRALAAHALEVGVVQAALILWFAWHPLALVHVALIAGTHFGIDAAKLRLDARLPRWRMSWFWLDQAVHLTVLAFVWSSWPESESPMQPSDYPLVGHMAVVAIIYAFNVNGASALVSLLLDGLRDHRPDPEGPTSVSTRESASLVWERHLATVRGYCLRI